MGAGEVFEVDWRDIEAVENQHFAITELEGVVGDYLNKQSINEKNSDE